MAKHPATRGFTLAEKRSLQFENIALYMVLLVALIAAAISFIALRAVGADAGLGRASFLLPLAIDGFGIACSVGIIKSVAEGESFRGRMSEWFGLFGALALSILGNIYHALEVGAATLPDEVKIAYAAAIPLIVAYGIHVYGRAMSKGISAHVMASDPDQIQFDLRHIGDQHAKAARQPRAPKAPTARTPLPNVVREEPAPRAQQPAAPSAQSDEQAAARTVFDSMVAANPHTKPDAAQVREAAGIEKHPATVRRWVQGWWDAVQEDLTGQPAPIAAQVAAEAKGDEQGSAALRTA